MPVNFFYYHGGKNFLLMVVKFFYQGGKNFLPAQALKAA
jgi:hypothetical protein